VRNLTALPGQGPHVRPHLRGTTMRPAVPLAMHATPIRRASGLRATRSLDFAPVQRSRSREVQGSSDPSSGHAKSSSSRHELSALPWASKARLLVTPPPRASWRTNFRARSWGTS
jgi:hypothetical protein